MKYLLILALLLTTASAEAKTVYFDKERTIQITGTIGQDFVPQLKKMAELIKTKKPIYIIIDSGGGNVGVGLEFYSAHASSKN